MKILIVDDEPLARSRLRALIDDLGVGEVVGEAGNGEEALDQFRQYSPNVVLMDIRMPGMDGMEAARQLGNQANAPSIVFTTAYDEYALQAFDVHAMDYLVKPVRRERLAEALDRVASRLSVVRELGGAQSQQLSVRSQGGVRLIELEDVYYFLAEHKYVMVHHRDGEDLLEEPLKSLEDRFSGALLRIHRNALVAANQLLALERDSGGQFKAVLREADIRLDVSRRHLPLVREFLTRSGSGTR